MNSRSASRAPAAWARASPTPTDPAGLVDRDHSAADPPVASTVAPADTFSAPACERVATPDAAAVLHQQRGGGGVLHHAHAVVPGGQRGQLARDAPAGGRPAGVHDPACRMAALQAQRQRAVAVGVEAHAHALQVAHPVGRVGHSTSTALGRATPRPASRVSCDVALGAVVHRQGRRDTALGPVAGGSGQRGA